MEEKGTIYHKSQLAKAIEEPSGRPLTLLGGKTNQLAKKKMNA